MVPSDGIKPSTYSLPKNYSITELQRHVLVPLEGFEPTFEWQSRNLLVVQLTIRGITYYMVHREGNAPTSTTYEEAALTSMLTVC